jgi:hypothetical protein
MELLIKLIWNIIWSPISQLLYFLHNLKKILTMPFNWMITLVLVINIQAATVQVLSANHVRINIKQYY